MQIPYRTKTDLARYYKLTKACRWELPSYRRRCLICGGADCARLLGYYERRVVAPELGLDVPDFRVYRYECQRKGSRLVSTHRTFSLLPIQLVPYRRLSLAFMVMAVLECLRSKVSLWDLSSRIERLFVSGEMLTPFLYPRSILIWRCILHQGVLRLLAVGPARLGMLIEEGESLDQQLQDMLAGVSCAREGGMVRIRGPDELAWRYHELLHGERGGGHFLFGTPSQERGVRR